MIPVVRPYLPDRRKLDSYIDKIYQSNQLTNNGGLVKELTSRLEEYLGVKHLLLVNNGTLALQVAYTTFGLGAEKCVEEAITTPFTFIATASSLKWQGINPVFTDINRDTWCLDPKCVKKGITDRTRLLVPVHVFGNGCEVEELEKIAQQYGVKVIYDAAHAFGVKYNDRSLLAYGDASAVSFHATKLFHTIEGGAIIFKNPEDHGYASEIINFGMTKDSNIESLGINCKMNEFQAAMGLCVLEDIDNIIAIREEIFYRYKKVLTDWVGFQVLNEKVTMNYSYFPILLSSESEVVSVRDALESNGIFPRRYFHPSLDTLNLPGFDNSHCDISRMVSRRVLCLPMFFGLSNSQVDTICSIVKSALSRTPVIDQPCF
ncbi:dTDP-4-amino-4,6-dideoxygalactose transaminase [Halomonas ventosae]|uniref:dTDP-4-amino-4,6-dideoxygalactose transaminase n=1 Tax=Halomonas ventosae TaxID=229007 RepID=A0A4R6ZX16_9GAMM|nr:DegT/DnrJ/EryC1/StrS family aminotransferase [Halomonas ventosae]TDR57288.1 dTDP-4-amino-4,6-dideoxygalactose transaminase [Halomonas ventosae]